MAHDLRVHGSPTDLRLLVVGLTNTATEYPTNVRRSPQPDSPTVTTHAIRPVAVTMFARCLLGSHGMGR
jgi:hypothetical protein